MDRFVVYLPRWLRWSLLVGLAMLVLAFSLAFFFGYATARYSEWLPAAVSVVQIALTALAYVLLVFFTESGRNPANLEDRATRLLTQLLPSVLARMTDADGNPVTSTLGQPSGIVGYDYRLSSRATRMSFWVGLNVHRAIVIVFCEWPEATSEVAFRERLETVFKDTLQGAQAIGYDKPHIQATVVNGHRVASIWLTWNIKGVAGMEEQDLLTHGPSQLFFAQDVAMMMQSFLRTGQREGIKLATPVTPMPL